MTRQEIIFVINLNHFQFDLFSDYLKEYYFSFEGNLDTGIQYYIKNRIRKL